MRRVILIGDGMGDYPLEQLSGETPLTRAKTPNMDGLARRGCLGLARNVPPSMPVGSDVANLSIMGYDPRIHYSGRGPLEAASMGIGLGKDDVAFRCNLVTVTGGLLDDYSSGHIPTAHAAELMEMLDGELGADGMRFHAGKSYRNLLVTGPGFEELECAPPHDHMGEPVADCLPAGPGQEKLRELMARGNVLLEDHPVNVQRRRRGEKPANWFWPWGQGRAPEMEPLTRRFGVSGSVVAAVDLILGLGVYAGLKPVTVPGGTGYLDTDYTGKANKAVELLKNEELVIVHVEAPDEAAHGGMLEEKVEAIERFDEEVVGTVVEALDGPGDYRVLVLTDHYTPISVRTHTPEPVPFAMYPRPDGMEPGDAFDEKSAAGRSVVEGCRLIDMLFDG